MIRREEGNFITGFRYFYSPVKIMKREVRAGTHHLWEKPAVGAGSRAWVFAFGPGEIPSEAEGCGTHKAFPSSRLIVRQRWPGLSKVPIEAFQPPDTQHRGGT
jgi:hypothetical protein